MNAEPPIGPFVRPAIPDDAEGIAKVHVKGWQDRHVVELANMLAGSAFSMPRPSPDSARRS